MTTESAAFVFGFSFMQLALTEAASATIGGVEAMAAEMHRGQAQRMLKHLGLPVKLESLLNGDWENKRHQAESMCRLLEQTRSKSVIWCFRLGCDLSALSSVHNQSLSSAQLGALNDKLKEECRESRIPFDIVQDLIWAAADTAMKQAEFIKCVSEVVNRVAENLEGRSIDETAG